MVTPLSGFFHDGTFECDTGRIIQNYSTGFWGWLSHLFGQNVFVDVQDPCKGKIRLYIPLRETREILQKQGTGIQLVADKIGQSLVKVLTTDTPEVAKRKADSQQWQHAESVLMKSNTFNTSHKVPGTPFQVKAHLSRYLETIFTVKDASGRDVADLCCEIIGFKDDKTLSSVGRPDRNTIKTPLFPLNKLFVDVRYCRIFRKDVQEREKIAKTLLQSVVEYGDAHGVDSLIQLSTSYDQDTLFYPLGMQGLDQQANEFIETLIKANDHTDHRSKTMISTPESLATFRQQIQKAPIFTPENAI